MVILKVYLNSDTPGNFIQGPLVSAIAIAKKRTWMECEESN